jgi:hypothetical protein
MTTHRCNCPHLGAIAALPETLLPIVRALGALHANQKDFQKIRSFFGCYKTQVATRWTQIFDHNFETDIRP